MICSKSSLLKDRINEYALYVAACEWNFDKAYQDLVKGAKFEKKDLEENASKIQFM